MSKLGKSVPNLKQFMLKKRVIQLYREMLKTIRQVPDKNSREELMEWVRGDFRKNKNVEDEYAIKMLILHGDQALKELRGHIALAR